MTTAPAAGTAPAAAVSPGFDRGAAVTRSLLGYGLIAGPWYLAVGLAQAFLRDGFDFRRHALSHLANGPYGWVQTANFLLTGLMILAAAIGMARAGGAGFRWPARFLGGYGIGVLLGGVFRADPVPGLPPGTPEATTMTTMGMLHFAAGGIGFLSLTIACWWAARALSGMGRTGGARLSALAGVVVIAGFFGPAYLPDIPTAMAALWTSVVVGFGWLSLISRFLYRISPSPNC